MKHTPGPWRIKQGQYNKSIHAIDLEKFKVRTIAHIPYYGARGELNDEQNANLIAASPELLEACKAALDATDKNATEVRDMLRNAIAKAEGVTP